MSAALSANASTFQLSFVCPYLGREVTVEAWEDSPRWGYTCECRTEVWNDINDDDPGHPDPADRGSTTAAASLFVLGFILVVGPLVSLFTMPGTLTHQLLILTGALLMAGIAAVGTVAAIQRVIERDALQRRNHS